MATHKRVETMGETHIERTARLEANWEAFFSEQGAFPIVMEKIQEHGRKIDRLTWLVAVGMGILLAVQVILKVAKP